MNNDWQEYLVTQGAVLDSNNTLCFPQTEENEFDDANSYLCDLSNLGVISASGVDAHDFLHGQFTNDINLVNDNSSQLSSYCNPKGRMLAIFRIYKRDDDYVLLMRRDVIEPVLKKLNMFKLMAKVELSDITKELVVFGVTGEKAVALLNENNIKTPNEHEQTVSQQDLNAIYLAGKPSRILLVTSTENAKLVWNSLKDQCIQADHTIWELIDIQNGIPQISKETAEAFIPQMVNLELIGGVNFQKGCYPGQEIVARTHYLGKPNRRMYRIRIDSNECPPPGSNIYSEADGEQPVGKIVNAQNVDTERCEALVVLRTEKQSANDLFIESSKDSAITILDLPYDLNAD